MPCIYDGMGAFVLVPGEPASNRRTYWLEVVAGSDCYHVPTNGVVTRDITYQLMFLEKQHVHAYEDEYGRDLGTFGCATGGASRNWSEFAVWRTARYL